MPKTKSAQSLLAVWDATKKPITLGGLLTLSAEARVLAKEQKIDLAGICFVGKHSGFPYAVAFQEVEEHMWHENWVLDVARSIAGIENVYVAPSISSLGHEFTLWPDPKDQSYKHATYFFLQNHCKEGKTMTSLGMKKQTLDLAKRYVKSVSGKAIPVAIHLKNNHNAPGCSNADFEAWKAFFLKCHGHHNVKFVLIGNEDVPEDIQFLDNVVLAKKQKLSIAEELAVIEASAFFMGMSSGPCNMALLALKPCAIFKNPEHDKQEMEEELGKRNRFLFCTPEQKLIRQFETPALLMKEFKRLYEPYEA